MAPSREGQGAALQEAQNPVLCRYQDTVLKTQVLPHLLCPTLLQHRGCGEQVPQRYWRNIPKRQWPPASQCPPVCPGCSLEPQIQADRKNREFLTPQQGRLILNISNIFQPLIRCHILLVLIPIPEVMFCSSSHREGSLAVLGP